MPPVPAVNPFEVFYQDPLYLELKNHIYSYRRRRDAIRRFLKKRPEGLLLETGSGISPIDDDFRNTVFSDISHEAMRYMARERRAARTVVTDASALAVRSGSVSTLVCSEVLEHIEKDSLAMQEMARVLGPGGMLILTVPAHARFYTMDDRFVGHKRRYGIRDLAEQLGRLGFSDFEFSAVTGFLDKLAALLAVAVFRVLTKISSGSPMRTGPARHGFLRLVLPVYVAANRFYAGLVKLEARLMPVGLCNVILIACKKKQKGTE